MKSLTFVIPIVASAAVLAAPAPGRGPEPSLYRAQQHSSFHAHGFFGKLGHFAKRFFSFGDNYDGAYSAFSERPVRPAFPPVGHAKQAAQGLTSGTGLLSNLTSFANVTSLVSPAILPTASLPTPILSLQTATAATQVPTSSPIVVTLTPSLVTAAASSVVVVSDALTPTSTKTVVLTIDPPSPHGPPAVIVVTVTQASQALSAFASTTTVVLAPANTDSPPPVVAPSSPVAAPSVVVVTVTQSTSAPTAITSTVTVLAPASHSPSPSATPIPFTPPPVVIVTVTETPGAIAWSPAPSAFPEAPWTPSPNADAGHTVTLLETGTVTTVSAGQTVAGTNVATSLVVIGPFVSFLPIKLQSPC